jgi:hypothetical protein
LDFGDYRGDPVHHWTGDSNHKNRTLMKSFSLRVLFGF